MKRFLGLALACAMVLAVASIAVAQKAPVPVTRMGDWVEIGNDAFMNIIGNIDMRYRAAHNWDFEDKVRDITMSTTQNSTTNHTGFNDVFEAEIRFGADFKYKKNLRTRILFETQSVFDGNLIDDRLNANKTVGGDVQTDGTANSPHVERFWVDYKFPNTPLRVRAGADLWYTDPAGILGDDDPRFAVFLTPAQNLELQAAAVIQTEASRSGLMNDNDDMYYTFGVHYNAKPHMFQLDMAYFRWRADVNEDFDTVLIIPSWKGKVGPISAILQPMIVVGSGNGTGGEDYDVFAYAVIARIEADLGMVRPFVGIIYGSGDDDAGDLDLQGFNNLPQTEVTLLRGFPEFDQTPTKNGYMNSPANTPLGTSSPSGRLFRHTTGNPFGDRMGYRAHTNIRSAYSNAGTLVVPVGVQILPAKGHRFMLNYVYVGFLEDELLVALSASGVGDNVIDSVSKDLYHEFHGEWNWTINRHLDVRLSGWIMAPGDGTKDLAASMNCDSDGVIAPCEGEDIALGAELRIRGRF